LPVSTGSSRNLLDDDWGMGKACSNEMERVPASRHGLSCEVKFGDHADLSYGGILPALPSLNERNRRLLLTGIFPFNYFSINYYMLFISHSCISLFPESFGTKTHYVVFSLKNFEKKIHYVVFFLKIFFNKTIAWFFLSKVLRRKTIAWFSFSKVFFNKTIAWLSLSKVLRRKTIVRLSISKVLR
jgi:hypothetical protein